MADYSKDFQIVYDETRCSCTMRFRCFDTPNAVTIYRMPSSGYEAEDVLLDVRRECIELHRLWSFSLEGSDVFRLNDSSQRVRVDVRTALLLGAMKSFHDKEPAFDFTVGPVSYLWKHAQHVPSSTELERALSHTGVGKLSIEGDVVVKADPLAKVDVGGAAKGFAADAVAARLRMAGVTCADIDLGGNLYMLGKHPSGRPWRVAVRVPEGIEAIRPVVNVVDRSVVTSGSYERFAEIDGKRYHHIVDVRTGHPVESDIVSATAIAASSLQADMLATTALMTGSKGLAQLKERHPEVDFIAILDSGEVVATTSFGNLDR